MYDFGKYTVAEIAETQNVGRSTLYRQLGAYKDGADCALVIYRNTRTRTRKVDPDTKRRYRGRINVTTTSTTPPPTDSPTPTAVRPRADQ